MALAPDVNGLVFAALRELAGVQTVRPKAQAYRRAAATIWALEDPLDRLAAEPDAIEALPGVGPSSLRVIREVLDTGRSATVDRAVAGSPRAADLTRARRDLRILSRAGVRAVLQAPARRGPTLAGYRGDLQMHSTWSDGRVGLADLAAACQARGYAYAAVTDHAPGLRIARGLSIESIARQHAEIDRLNARAAGRAGRVRILKGIEANIDADGALDLAPEALARFEIVLAAPHSALRSEADQTKRLLRVVRTPGVHVLAHPRGRVAGTRAGIVADWDAVFAEAARHRVAIELDGFADRQDLDHALAARALAAGCLFALDSDAHGPEQLPFAETAVAHARLAGIPASRVVNCWPLPKLLDWARDR